MNQLHAFLRYLFNRYSNNFIVEGVIISDNNVIRELYRIDPLSSIKFSLQIAEPNRIINLIENWAPRANAEVKQIHWRDLDSLVTINCYSKSIELTARSLSFINECTYFANQMEYHLVTNLSVPNR
jgi:hypothetical protein